MANKNWTENHAVSVDYSTALATRFIGRDAELAAIDRVARMDTTQLVQIIGEGGTGKTRLLKEILERYRNRDDRFVVAKEIIDFYHIANHSIEGLMDAIYRAFESDEMKLVGYVAARQKLDRHLAEPPSGGSASLYPNLLKAAQEALVADLNSQVGARRLVLVLDTAEKLVYEITAVERALGLTREQLSIWRWLCSEFMPGLKEALVIIAGRRASKSLLIDLEATSVQVVSLELGNFNEPDALAYIDAVAETIQHSRPELAQRIGAWTRQRRSEIIRKAEGRPILLALTIDCLAVARGLNLSALGADGELEDKLTEIIQNTNRPEDDVIRVVARTRKGMTAELLARLLGLKTASGDWDIDSAQERMDAIKNLSFVKSFGDVRVFLHDKMYDLMDQHVLSRLSPRESARSLEIITSFSHERVAQARSRLEEVRESHDYHAVRKETEALQAALTEDLHYQLQADAVYGFETYYRYAEEALQSNDMGLDAQLRAELLAFWAERDPEGNASNIDGLPRSQVNADGAIRWVRRRVAANKYGSALELADAIEQNHLISAEDQLSHLELSVWRLSTQVYTESAPESIEAPLESAIATLERSPDSWRVSCVLAHVYNELGYLRRVVGRQYAAIDSYGKAVPLWRKVKLEAAQADTLNNQAFALSNVGNFDRAKRLSKDALEIRERLGNRSAIGLSLNTRALIEMQDGDLHQAEVFSKLALKPFMDVGDERGLALARVALAEIRRRQATEGERLPAAEAERLLRKAIADAKVACKGFREIAERVRHVDALIQLGCVYRDLMYVRREYPGKKTVEELTHLARKTFSEARKWAGGKGLQALDVWVREAWTNYYLASYYSRMAEVPNLAHAQEAISQVLACLVEASTLVDTQFHDYWITPERGLTPKDKEKIVIPVLTQIAKIELLKGQMALNRFENCRAQTPGERSEAENAIREGIEHYTLSLEYDDVVSARFNFHDMRLAKDRIYERLKKLNTLEWQIAYEAVSKIEIDYRLPPGESAMSRFLEQNFGSKEELKPIPDAGGDY